MPTVSVIMNCLNCAKYLREAIDSVFAQTYTDWEIIFWDNASTDNSAEIAKSYGEKVRYFRSKETVPLGKARNWAIEKARGKYIAFLDCDDVWLPTKLEKQIPLFEKNARTGLVFSDCIIFNNKGANYRLYGKRKPPRGKVFRKLLKGYFLSLPTIIIRRDVLNNLNEWFDERFNMIEEMDLFLRIAYKWEVDYVNKPLAKWRMHGENWTSLKKYLFPEEEEMLRKFYILYKNFDKQFKDEILLIKAKIQYQYALLDWQKGKKKIMRRRLYPNLGIDKKLWIPYFLGFLPYEFYMQLINLYRIIRLKLGIYNQL